MVEHNTNVKSSMVLVLLTLRMILVLVMMRWTWMMMMTWILDMSEGLVTPVWLYNDNVSQWTKQRLAFSTFLSALQYALPLQLLYHSIPCILYAYFNQYPYSTKTMQNHTFTNLSTLHHSLLHQALLYTILAYTTPPPWMPGAFYQIQQHSVPYFAV